MTGKKRRQTGGGSSVPDNRAHEELRRRAYHTCRTEKERMSAFVAAAALLVAGRRGSEMNAPEPTFQGGHEPNEVELALMAALAQATGRDLVHVGFHRDGSGMPSGMIAVISVRNGVARPHRRGGLWAEEGDAITRLVGFADDDLEDSAFFEFAPGRSMIRKAKALYGDPGPPMMLAGVRWMELVASGTLGDCSGEFIRHYFAVEAPRGALGVDGVGTPRG